MNKFVKNIVRDEKIVKNIVKNAQTDPNVEMYPSNLKLVDGTISSPSNQSLMDEFLDENEPWLSVGIPNRDPFFVTHYMERHSARSDQHMKKLTSFREGLLMMVQCYMRQHLADRYWLHGMLTSLPLNLQES